MAHLMRRHVVNRETQYLYNLWKSTPMDKARRFWKRRGKIMHAWRFKGDRFESGDKWLQQQLDRIVVDGEQEEFVDLCLAPSPAPHDERSEENVQDTKPILNNNNMESFAIASAVIGTISQMRSDSLATDSLHTVPVEEKVVGSDSSPESVDDEVEVMPVPVRTPPPVISLLDDDDDSCLEVMHVRLLSPSVPFVIDKRGQQTSCEMEDNDESIERRPKSCDSLVQFDPLGDSYCEQREVIITTVRDLPDRGANSDDIRLIFKPYGLMLIDVDFDSQERSAKVVLEYNEDEAELDLAEFSKVAHFVRNYIVQVDAPKTECVPMKRRSTSPVNNSHEKKKRRKVKYANCNKFLY